VTKKALRIISAWAVLGAIIACNLPEDEDDNPPPPPQVVQPNMPQPNMPQPNMPQPNMPQPNMPQPNMPQPNVVPEVAAVPFSLSSGFLPDPHILRGQSGGPRGASSLSPSCRGNIPNTPQHVVDLGTAFQYLRIMVRANGDTTLAVRMPDGSYRCEDDSESVNPIVDGSFPPGRIEIYVGSYHQGARSPYVLGLTEMRGGSVYDLPL
jgi:hypothetical protein